MGRFRFHLVRKRKAKPFLRLLLFFGFIVTPILCVLVPIGIETHPDLVQFAFLSFCGCFVVIWTLFAVFFVPLLLYIHYTRQRKEIAVLQDPNSPPEERSKARIRMRPKPDSLSGRIQVKVNFIVKSILFFWLIVNTFIILSDVFFNTSIAKGVLHWFTQFVNGS